MRAKFNWDIYCKTIVTFATIFFQNNYVHPMCMQMVAKNAWPVFMHVHTLHGQMQESRNNGKAERAVEWAMRAMQVFIVRLDFLQMREVSGECTSRPESWMREVSGECTSRPESWMREASGECTSRPESWMSFFSVLECVYCPTVDYIVG